MDNNGNKKLDIEEFTQALATFGLFPKKVDVQGLMTYYDINQDGSIGYEEFIRGLRDPLTQRKRDMVNKAFSIMDKDGSKQLGVSDIAYRYDVTSNEDFMSGAKTKDQVLGEFLDQFDGLRKQRWKGHLPRVRGLLH